MPIRICERSVLLRGQQVPFRAFPRLLTDHLDTVYGTEELERAGRALRQRAFPLHMLLPFIPDVCTWGGYAGIAARIERRNTGVTIRRHFKRASALLSEGHPGLASAMRELNEICDLGKPSYSSKHLRFLYPEYCPILDSMFAQDLMYSYDPAGYEELAHDFQQLATTLRSAGIKNPRRRPAGSWFAADVDMALNAWVRHSRGHW